MNRSNFARRHLEHSAHNAEFPVKRRLCPFRQQQPLCGCERRSGRAEFCHVHWPIAPGRLAFFNPCFQCPVDVCNRDMNMPLLLHRDKNLRNEIVKELVGTGGMEE